MIAVYTADLDRTRALRDAIEDRRVHHFIAQLVVVENSADHKTWAATPTSPPRTSSATGTASAGSTRAYGCGGRFNLRRSRSYRGWTKLMRGGRRLKSGAPGLKPETASLQIPTSRLDLEAASLQIRTSRLDLKTANLQFQTSNLHLRTATLQIRTPNLNLRGASLRSGTPRLDLHGAFIWIPPSRLGGGADDPEADEPAPAAGSEPDPVDRQCGRSSPRASSACAGARPGCRSRTGRGAARPWLPRSPRGGRTKGRPRRAPGG